MNNNPTNSKALNSAFYAALAAGVAGQLSFLPSALAQAATNEATRLKPVVVTGSNIPTVEAEGPSPILRISREDIEQSGLATVSEVLRRIPQNNAGSFDEKFSNSFAPGSSGVSLRGLGQQNTLVLVNGRRLAPYGFSQNINESFVDLNSLPLAAIERIEVFKDSASAIYGSDAIAGVINIILRKEYSGVEMNARIGNTFSTDTFEQLYSLVGGTSNDRSSALLVVDYFHREALFLKDRWYSRSANHGPSSLNAFGEPTGLNQGGFDFRSGLGPDPGVILAIPGTGNLPGFGSTSVRVNADGSGFTAPAGAVNRYDFNPAIVSIPETTRYGAYATMDHKVYDWMDVFAEVSYRNVNTRNYQAPTPIVGDRPPDLFGHPGGVVLLVPATNPFNPFGTDVTFRKRLVEAGPRINEIETDAIRVLSGLRFHLPGEWEAETAMLYSKVKVYNQGRNYLHAERVQAALNDTDPATALNVFGVGSVNNPATIEGIKFRTTRNADSELLQGDVRAAGPLFELPAGKLQLAVGAEGRRERISDIADDTSLAEKQVASGGTSSRGNREAGAIFAEINIPIFSEQNAVTGLRTLEITAAGRFEHYSDFGSTANPKVGLKWRPIDELLIRGTYSRGFRAPSLVELFSGQSVAYPFVVDNNTNSPLYNLPAQYRGVLAGNPDLDPEESDSWTVGFIYEPKFAKGVTLYADFFRIKHTDKIDAFSFGLIPEIFPDQVGRDPNTQEITSITNTFQNLATRKVEGVDFGISYDLSTDIGDFTVRGDAAYIHSWKDQAQPGGLFIQRAGTYNFPQWRATGSAFWKYQRYGAGAAVNYIGSYDQANFDFNPIPELEPWITVDLQASVELPYQFKVTLGILNVFDEPPPFSDNEIEGYDFTTHDPRGRFWYLALNKKF